MQTNVYAGGMDGGGLSDDDVYAAMAAATAHSQAAAEVHPCASAELATLPIFLDGFLQAQQLRSG